MGCGEEERRGEEKRRGGEEKGREEERRGEEKRRGGEEKGREEERRRGEGERRGEEKQWRKHDHNLRFNPSFESTPTTGQRKQRNAHPRAGDSLPHSNRPELRKNTSFTHWSRQACGRSWDCDFQFINSRIITPRHDLEFASEFPPSLLCVST